MLHANERHIYKYPLHQLMSYGKQVVETRRGAMVVLVDQQQHVPTVWMEVSLIEPEERRLFVLYGTGQLIDDNDIPVGSYIDGDFVWHIYESNP